MERMSIINQTQRRLIPWGFGVALVALFAVSSCSGGTSGEAGASAEPDAQIPATLTPTLAASDTPLPSPSDTLAPTDTLTPTPTITNTPAPRVTVALDSYCFAGPGPGYTLIGVVMAGSEVEVVGIGFGGGWYIIKHPLLVGLTCWVDELDLNIEGDLGDLPVWQIPPLPSATPTPLRGGGGIPIPCWTATPGGGPFSVEPHPVCDPDE